MSSGSSPHPFQQLSLFHQSHSASSAPSLPHPHHHTTHSHTSHTLPIQATLSHTQHHHRSHSQTHSRSLSIGSGVGSGGGMGGLSTLAQQALLGGKREASPALSLASSVGGSGSGIGGAGIGSNGISSRSGTGVGGSDVLFRQHMEGGQSQSQSQTRFSGSPLLGGGDEVFSGGSIYSTTMNTIRVGQVRGQGMQEGRGYHQHPTLGFSTYAMPQPLLYPTGPEDLSPFEFKNPRSWFGEEGGVGTGMVEAEVMQPGSRLDLGFGRYGGVGREEEDSEEEGKDGGEEVQGARELEVSTSGTTEAPMSSDAPSQEPSNTAGPTDSSNPPSTTSQNQSQPRTAQVSSPPQHQHQHPRVHRAHLRHRSSPTWKRVDHLVIATPPKSSQQLSPRFLGPLSLRRRYGSSCVCADGREACSRGMRRRQRQGTVRRFPDLKRLS